MPSENKRQKNIRVSDRGKRLLVKLAARDGISQADVLEIAVREELRGDDVRSRPSMSLGSITELINVRLTPTAIQGIARLSQLWDTTEGAVVDMLIKLRDSEG